MNIQRNEWTVFSIYQRHSPSISFVDRSSNDLEDRDEDEKRAKEESNGGWNIAFCLCVESTGKFLSGEKDVLKQREREREREIRKINQKERETGRGIKGKLREEIETPSIETKRTDTRHVVRDHATDRARSNNFQGGSFRRKCVEARSSSLHYRCLAMPPNHRAERWLTPARR